MTPQPDRAIRSICIVGAGITGLSAALAFARSLPMVQLTLVETPADPANLTDRLPSALPVMRGFHDLIGLSERDLVRAGIATHRLATRFEGWSHSGESWLHAHGDYGQPADGVAFHQLWAAAQARGDVELFDHYSLAAVLADAGRFTHPSPEPASPLAAIDYALRLDPVAYHQLLDQRCTALEIARVAGDLLGVERRDDGGIASLHCSDGATIAADLFLDCGGPSAPLLSVLTGAFDDWSAWLPCDQFMLEGADATAPQCSDLVTANDGGWQWRMPLAQRAIVATCTASAFAATGETRAAVSVKAGTRPSPWVHNILALGDAAMTMAPLLPINLTLVHNAIARALTLLPGRDCHAVELAEYSRRTALETRRVRDFAALHMLRSGRQSGALWQALASVPPPDSLAHTLDQFVARGRLPFYEEEIFGPQAWAAALLGLGVVPSAVDAASGRVDAAVARQAMARFALSLRDITERALPYPEYLRRMQMLN